MGLTRRNTVIGLGALVGGAGLISATGAFDAVEADRSFDIEVDGDDDALLGISVENDVIAEYVDGGAGDNDVIQFNLQDDAVEADDAAINEDALNEFFDVFSLTNNGSQEVQITIELGEDVDGVQFLVRGERADNDDLADVGESAEIDLSEDGVDVPEGESVHIDLVINTRHTDDDPDGGYTEPDEDPYEITLRAESDEAQDD